MSITNPLASLFGGQATGQTTTTTAQSSYMNQLGAGGGAGAYQTYANQAAMQQAMNLNLTNGFYISQSEQKKYKLLEEEECDLLLNNEGLRELAAIRDEANAKYQAFLALLRKV